MTEYIYKLINPRTNLPFYIGRTNDPQRRYKEHCHPGYSNQVISSRYIEILRCNDMMPTMEIICTCESVIEAEQLENKYIEEYWNKYTLLNELLPTGQHPWVIPKTKQERVALCGIGGKHCGYYTDCELCYNHEKNKRIAFIIDELTRFEFVYRAEIDPSDWSRIRKSLSREGIDSFRVFLDNGKCVIISSGLIGGKKKKFFNRMPSKDAIDELSRDEYIFPQKRRGSTGKWKLS